MKTHRKTRIEIIIEAPLLNRLTDLLDRTEVGGYTILPAMAGRGEKGSWDRKGQVTDAGHMVAVVCITDPQRSDSIVEALYDLVSRHTGIVCLSEVEVIRSEKF